MDYSKRIQAILKKNKIEIGQRISVTKGKEHFEGLLMPKSSGSPDALVIKLDNGYNIGIDFKNAKIKKLNEKRELGSKPKGLEFDSSKPKVALITTGGTITSKVDYRTGAVHMLMKPEEFLMNVPELKEIVNISKIVSPFSIASEDMDYKTWQTLATLTAKELNKDNKGVILTHGTDVLHFTSAALSFMLPNLTKPLVIAGAQRSSDRGSADTAMNLICASHTALSDIAEVGICMHASSEDNYCLFNRGTKVRKMHTSRRDAFRPINDLPLAKVWPNGKIEVTNEYRKRSDGKVKADIKFEEKVALVKAYPGSDPDYLKFFVDKKYKGIVIEATGLGHVPTQAKKSWIPAVKKIAKDLPIVITSQTLYGRTNPNVYSNLRTLADAGAIFGEDMLPETAYIKLGWVLGHTKDMEKIKELMTKNLVGEISTRTGSETFLY